MLFCFEAWQELAWQLLPCLLNLIVSLVIIIPFRHTIRGARKKMGLTLDPIFARDSLILSTMKRVWCTMSARIYLQTLPCIHAIQSFQMQKCIPRRRCNSNGKESAMKTSNNWFSWLIEMKLCCWLLLMTVKKKRGVVKNFEKKIFRITLMTLESINFHLLSPQVKATNATFGTSGKNY